MRGIGHFSDKIPPEAKRETHFTLGVIYLGILKDANLSRPATTRHEDLSQGWTTHRWQRFEHCLLAQCGREHNKVASISERNRGVWEKASYVRYENNPDGSIARSREGSRQRDKPLCHATIKHSKPAAKGGRHVISRKLIRFPQVCCWDMEAVQMLRTGQGRIQPGKLGGKKLGKSHYGFTNCNRDKVCITTLLWQNNGRQNGLISRMLSSQLYKIMVNKVTLVNFRGAIAPIVPLDPPLRACRVSAELQLARARKSKPLSWRFSKQRPGVDRVQSSAKSRKEPRSLSRLGQYTNTSRGGLKVGSEGIDCCQGISDERLVCFWPSRACSVIVMRRKTSS